jgi:hypothetical protein
MDAPDGVIQNGKAPYHRLSPIGHNGDMGLPVKGAGDEDTKVPHLVLGLHLHVTIEGVRVGSKEGRGAD